jgi:hypothetical protein
MLWNVLGFLSPMLLAFAYSCRRYERAVTGSSKLLGRRDVEKEEWM